MCVVSAPRAPGQTAGLRAAALGPCEPYCRPRRAQAGGPEPGGRACSGAPARRSCGQGPTGARGGRAGGARPQARPGGWPGSSAAAMVGEARAPRGAPDRERAAGAVGGTAWGGCATSAGRLVRRRPGRRADRPPFVREPARVYGERRLGGYGDRARRGIGAADPGAVPGGSTIAPGCPVAPGGGDAGAEPGSTCVERRMRSPGLNVPLNHSNPQMPTTTRHSRSPRN